MRKSILARAAITGSVGLLAIGCGSGPGPTGDNSPVPGSLTIVEGDGQSGLTGRSPTTSPTVLVRDQAGSPLAGISVTWVVTGGGGTVSGSGPTNATGQATASWVLGPDPGINTLEARVQGLSPGQFSATGVSIAAAMAVEVMLTETRSPTDIVLMTADGTLLTNLTKHPADDGDPAWSPDRTKVVFKSDRDARPGFPLDYDLYVLKVDGSGVTRLTNTPERDVKASWSPDGGRIAFSSMRDGNFEIYVMNADGSNQVRLTNDPGSDGNPDWSPDGSRILFATTRYGNREIAVMNTDGSSVVRLTNDSGDDDEPAWSPDGRRIAFSTNRFSGVRTDLYEVAVMNADGSGATRLAVHPGSSNDYGPTWSPDGTKISYTCWRPRGAEVHSEVCTMNADGTGEFRMTSRFSWASWPAWSR